MSSHHFVREGQEPALFIVEASTFSSIAPLLEWAPLVMVLDSAVDIVLSWGVKIDVVFIKSGQPESFITKVTEQMPIKILFYDTDVDPLLVGLKELETNQKAVHIVTRVSEDVFTKAEQYINKMDVAILDDNVRWIPVANTFQKWLPSKSILYTKANKQPIRHTGLIERAVDLFEIVADGNVSIESPGIFWVGETIE